jgi:CheY-like chemotaxis protein
MPTPAAPARVVLVEDDASLRRFVQMALEELDIELVPCAGVAQAVLALQAAPARLVLTDLMLGGESGLQFVERLAGDPALRSDARVVVLSAGITPELRQRLGALGVWRFLPKPVGLQELERCVEEALDAGDHGDRGPSQAATSPGLPQLLDEATVISRHFNGDAQLYRGFLASCLAQFPFDVRIGDNACAAQDMPALCRLVHSLKTVLSSLGYASEGELAALVERHAAQGEPGCAVAGWNGLRQQLLALAVSRPA